MMPCRLKGIDGNCHGLSYYLRAIQNPHIHGPIFFFLTYQKLTCQWGCLMTQKISFGSDIKLVLPEKLSNTVAIDPCTVAAAVLA